MTVEPKDSGFLMAAGRDPKLPFTVPVAVDRRIVEMTCRTVLRVVPGRRIVCGGDCDGREAVVKFFLDPRRGRRHLKREVAGLGAMAAAGVRVPEILLQGRVPPGRVPALVVSRISGAVSLLEAWNAAAGEVAQRDLLSRAVSLVAAQHRAGIRQKDMHGENFLVRDRDVVVIDGASVDARRQGKPLGIPASLRNLALFFTLLPRSEFHLIDATFDAYAARRGWQAVGQQLRARLLTEIKSQVEHQRKAWLKKVFRESTPFVCIRSWRRRMVCRRPDYTDEMTAFLDDPDRCLKSARRIKDGNSATVFLVSLNGTRMVVKRYNIKNIVHRLRRCLRPSRAAVSWRNSHLLDHLGLYCPRAVAMLERRWGPFRSSAYLVSELVPGPHVLGLLGVAPENPAAAERVARLFFDLLQTLADHLICHGDMKATNFIAAGNRLYSLDLDAMHRFRCRARFRRAFGRDLQRLMRNWVDLPVAQEAFGRRIGDIRW